MSSLWVVNLRGKVCNDYRECLRQSESFAVLSNVLSSRGIVGLDVSDCSLPAIQFRSEIGMTEQNTNDSQAQCHRLILLITIKQYPVTDITLIFAVLILIR